MIDGDDMQVLKGYVFRMYPTKEQEELINKKHLDVQDLSIIIF